MTSAFVGPIIDVRDEWLDYNRHVTDSAYAVMCSVANEAFLDHVGLGAAYLARTRCSLYTVESHLRYLSEVTTSEEVRSETFIVETDAKRLRLHTTLRVADRSALTGEYLYLHFDQARGRVIPFPPDRLAVLAAESGRHVDIARPAHLGRGVEGR